MRHSPALRFGLLVSLLAAACGNDNPKKEEPPGHSGGALPPPTALQPAATVSASASATTSASAPAPGALPSADPPTVHTAAPTASAAASAKPDASTKPDAGAKPPPPKVAATAAPDAGASDAGAAAAADAGAAAANPALAIARQVDAIFVGKKTFSAKFKQQYTIQAYGTTKDFSGVVFIERPSKISFRYDPPNKDRIVSDGTTIKWYQAELSQMTEVPMAKTTYPGALGFMMGTGISQSFDFAINTKAQWNGGVVLDGKPLTANQGYDLAMFYIDQALLQKSDPNAMKRVLVIDAQRNKNRFDFENISHPATINADEFTFTPPAGTEIKRQGL